MSHENHSLSFGNLTLIQPNTGEERDLVEDISLWISIFLFITIVAGNVSVLVALLFRNIRNQMRWFIVNLAATDLCVAVGVLKECILSITVQFRASNEICRLIRYLSSVSMYASSFALIVLSIDRAEAVCRPLRAATSRCSNKTQARLLIGGAWLAALLCGIPGLLLARKVGEGTEMEDCALDFDLIEPKIYLPCIALSVFVIPALIIAVCHIIMVKTIWKASKLQYALSDCRTVREHRDSEPLSSSHGCSSHTENHHRIRLAVPKYVRHKRASTDGFLQKPRQSVNPTPGCIPKARIKTVKMTCLIVSVYIICWCPFMIWNFLVTFHVLGTQAPHLNKYTPIIQRLVPLNSAANPIIFWVFNASSICNKAKHSRVTSPATQVTR